MNVRNSSSAMAALCALALLLLNTVIAAPLFDVEYSAHTGSNEGSFIAISRVMIEHPGEWLWWPYWAGGMPFELTYLPLIQWAVAVCSVLTDLSPARCFHIVTAMLYISGPLGMFWMALTMSRRLPASFIAAFVYSCLSLSALLVPEIRTDAGGPLNLRRLQALVFYGAAPQVAGLALAPFAIGCFYRALHGNGLKWKLLAGVMAAGVALTNAFGVATLGIAVFCLLATYPTKRWWKGPATIATIAAASYCWVAPWISPSLIRAIRENSMTAGGDYTYTAGSWLAVTGFAAGFVLLPAILRRTVEAPSLRFFVLLAYPSTVFVAVWYAFGIAVVPQANRYHLDLDMFVLLAVTFGIAAALEGKSLGARVAVAGVALAASAGHAVYGSSYARNLIREADLASLSEYKIAKWMDRNMPGERAFITGSSSFLYNVLSSNPQLHGAHEQHIGNYFVRVAAFQIYSGMNAGDRDAEYSVFWLKAFGARAISVSGPNSTEYFKSFANPGKFEGVLPLLWREGDDAIYGVPSISGSLAHVMPAEAIPARQPVHGLDIGPVEAYVAALEDPRYPPATFEWKGLSEAVIRAEAGPGQVIAVQITYSPGWEAHANGRPQRLRGDGIGQMVIEPDCDGPCVISLRYTGGAEAVATRALSFGAALGTLVFVWFARRPRRNG